MSSGLDPVEVGEKLRGATVTMVDEEVVDGPDRYHIKRTISLDTGGQMKDEYWREKKPGEGKTAGKKGKSALLRKKEQQTTIGLTSKKTKEDHRSEARAKARAMMAKRKSANV